MIQSGHPSNHPRPQCATPIRSCSCSLGANLDSEGVELVEVVLHHRQHAADKRSVSESSHVRQAGRLRLQDNLAQEKLDWAALGFTQGIRFGSGAHRGVRDVAPLVPKPFDIVDDRIDVPEARTPHVSICGKPHPTTPTTYQTLRLHLHRTQSSDCKLWMVLVEQAQVGHRVALWSSRAGGRKGRRRAEAHSFFSASGLVSSKRCASERAQCYHRLLDPSFTPVIHCNAL